MVRDNVLPIEEREELDVSRLAWGVDDRCMEDFDPSNPYKDIDPDVLAKIEEEAYRRGLPGARPRQTVV